MRKFQLCRLPHSARSPLGKNKAWWYEEDRCISIYIETNDGAVVSCKINRRELKAWLDKVLP